MFLAYLLTKNCITSEKSRHISNEKMEVYPFNKHLGRIHSVPGTVLSSEEIALLQGLLSLGEKADL